MIRSLINRHMRHAAGFTRSDAPNFATDVRLQPGEIVVGSYADCSSAGSPRLIFTTLGLYICWTDRAERIRWADITSHRVPPKQETTGVEIETVNGPWFIPIAGQHGPGGQVKDAFALVMLLRNLER